MRTRYQTLAGASEGIYKEKGSKFLAYACPVSSVEQVQEQLAALKRKHHKARHHCFAYILGVNGTEYRVSDDGEPRHSAGDPILGQLKSFDLVNTLVVVVRYFGGTKLGIGGLVNAYRESAKEALEKGHIVEKELCEVWHLAFAYSEMNQVMNLVKTLKLTIAQQSFEEQCKLSVEVPVVKKEQVYRQIETITGLELKQK